MQLNERIKYPPSAHTPWVALVQSGCHPGTSRRQEYLELHPSGQELPLLPCDNPAHDSIEQATLVHNNKQSDRLNNLQRKQCKTNTSYKNGTFNRPLLYYLTHLSSSTWWTLSSIIHKMVMMIWAPRHYISTGRTHKDPVEGRRTASTLHVAQDCHTCVILESSSNQLTKKHSSLISNYVHMYIHTFTHTHACAYTHSHTFSHKTKITKLMWCTHVPGCSFISSLPVFLSRIFITRDINWWDTHISDVIGSDGLAVHVYGAFCDDDDVQSLS